MIAFVSPGSGRSLTRAGDGLVDAQTSTLVAPVVRGVPRFVAPGDDYAESFGWQWNRWVHTLSDSRNSANAGAKRELVLRRTHFDCFELEGKTVLECGMGGGDDTEILLSLPFSEVHSFDISRSVDRARATLNDERLTLSQASIFDIPYREGSFDFVYCHRVLQHTPDPLRAIRCVARMAKPGGVVFVHAYHRSSFFMQQYKYKYRPLARRLSYERLAGLLDRFGPGLHRLNAALRSRGFLGRAIAHNFVPFEWYSSLGSRDEAGLVDLAKLVTFDALTPEYDNPLTWPEMRNALESEGCEVLFYTDAAEMPLLCTAKKR